MSKVYIVDIDGTICDKPNGCVLDGKYSNSIPKKDRIEHLNKLYDQGNTIKYFTARGMGTYNNDTKLAEARFREITELQLKVWGCKYHEFIMGKPSGDLYIDDKGINANDFFGN